MKHEKDYKNLEVEREFDTNTGNLIVTYKWKGAAVPKIQITGRAANRLSGLSLIQKDLNNALSWAKKIDELVKEVSYDQNDIKEIKDETRIVTRDREVFNEVKGLFVAALTFYAKAFTEAEGRKLQMERTWLDEPFREVHDYYMNYRHNFAAHSGGDKIEFAQSYLVLIPDISGNVTMRLHTSRFQPDFASIDDQDKNFTKLIENALGKVIVRYNDLAEKVIRAALKKKLKFWLNHSKDTNPFDIDEMIKKK